jgi:glyoxylase-like metal-dependent hydrolase (beta-lactamase superfamily II)
MPVCLKTFHDARSCTFTHVVHEPGAAACAIIDAVLGYDLPSGRSDTQAADQVIAYVRRQRLRVEWLLETHVHADHLSAAHYLRSRLGGRIGIGAAVVEVAEAFAPVFGPSDPGCFDHLFAADERFRIGRLEARALPVPGHTPADLAFQVDEDLVFVGDTLFAPDLGSARCDFPGGSAVALYRSIRRLLALPAQTRLLLCHDYPPDGRAPLAESSVAEQRQRNVHVNERVAEADFVAMREQRDAGLALPALFIPAIQVNLRGGALPAADANGVRYLRVPLDCF